MNEKRSLLVVIVILFMLVLGSAVFAVDKSDAVSGASVTVGSSNRYNATTPGSIKAQGGNVTFLNVTASHSTVKWAGFLGRVTSSLKLGFSTGVLYNFGSANTSQIKTILASPDTGFNFGNLVNATTAAVDSAWGFPQGHIDSATRTFTLTSPNAVAQVSNVKAVGLRAFTTGGILSTALYNSSIFADTTAPTEEVDFAFGTKVALNQRDFRNQSIVDYELIVPVNTSGLAGVQTYYFFLDIE